MPNISDEQMEWWIREIPPRVRGKAVKNIWEELGAQEERKDLATSGRQSHLQSR